MKQFKLVFIGSDGSGKTTFIEYFKKKLSKEGKTADVFFMGWRDFHNPLLKIASKIHLKRKKKKGRKENKLDRFKPRSWFFYLTYYSELWLRYLKVLFSQKDFILIDRYFYDELAFSQKTKFNFLKLITPKPDLCIILHSSPEILRKRKENISDSSLKNFYNHLFRIEKICKSVRIDSSNTREKMYEAVRKSLHKSL